MTPNNNNGTSFLTGLLNYGYNLLTETIAIPINRLYLNKKNFEYKKSIAEYKINFSESNNKFSEQLRLIEKYSISLETALQNLGSIKNKQFNFSDCLREYSYDDDVPLSIFLSEPITDLNIQTHQNNVLAKIIPYTENIVLQVEMEGHCFAVITIKESKHSFNNFLTSLKETNNLKLLKELGLSVLPYQQLALIELFNIKVPAKITPILDDIPGHIIIHHYNLSYYNPQADDGNTEVKNLETDSLVKIKDIAKDKNEFLQVMQLVISQIGILVKNNISLQPRSINFRILDSGVIELFLLEVFGNIIDNLPEAKNNLALHYTATIINMFLNFFTGINESDFNLIRQSVKENIEQLIIEAVEKE
jgi:hypothetical protein